MNWVWNHSRSKHGARLVLLAVADSMNSEHAWAWPSNPELARRTNMTGRAVQIAVAELVKLGELEVGFNEGPKGCNRYRVLMTPEKISPPKDFHPEDSSPPKDFRGSESEQVSDQTPEETSPPEDSSPPKKTTPTPEDSSPGTVNKPKTKNSPTESSTGQNSLFPDDETSPADTGGKRPRGRPPKSGGDPLFAEWYAAYPVHKARGDAEAAWAKRMQEGVDPQELIAAAQRYRNDPQVARGYAKHPATWLNKKCWLDEDTSPPQTDPPAAKQYPRGGAADPLTDQKYGPGSTIL